MAPTRTHNRKLQVVAAHVRSSENSDTAQSGAIQTVVTQLVAHVSACVSTLWGYRTFQKDFGVPNRFRPLHSATSYVERRDESKRVELWSLQWNLHCQGTSLTFTSLEYLFRACVGAANYNHFHHREVL